MELTICLKKEEVGKVVFSDNSISMEYAASWSQKGFPLSPHLPFREELNNKSVVNFINNLLPEGSSLEEISQVLGVSKYKTYPILKAIGSDPAGVFSFMKSECRDNATDFREIKEDELYDRVKTRRSKGLTVWDGKPRVSIAGVQQKLPVCILEGKVGFGDGELASTHILKFAEPDTNLVLNEFLSLSVAKNLGVPVAECELIMIADEPVLKVKRFDRTLAGGVIEKRHIIDGCQALDIPPASKYEWPFGHDGEGGGIRTGASLKSLFEFANTCRVPALTKRSLLQWTILNLFLHNADSHGKNVSFFVNGNGVSVAPFYDILCNSVLDGYSKELAMAIGDTYIHEELNYMDMEAFSDDCGVTLPLLKKSIFDYEKKIEEAVEKSIASVPELMDRNGSFINDYTKAVINNAKFIKDLF